MDDRRSSFDDLSQLMDLPNGKPLTDRPKTTTTRASELELAGILGPQVGFPASLLYMRLFLARDERFHCNLEPQSFYQY